MFKLQPNPTFKKTVSIPVPGEEAVAVTFIFKHMGRKAFKKFYESLTSTKSNREDADVLLEIVEGWEGVDGDFNKENLDLLLDNYFGSAMAILEAYQAALVEAREKN